MQQSTRSARMGLSPRGTAQGEGTAKAPRAGERRPHLLLALWYCRDLQWSHLCTQMCGFFLSLQAAEVPLTPNTQGSICSQGKAGASPAYLPGTSTAGLLSWEEFILCMEIKGLLFSSRAVGHLFANSLERTPFHAWLPRGWW